MPIEITTLSELTIDGKLSLGHGASSKGLFNFYGDELRTWFPKQRAQRDAIMVGAQTVRNDDPELTVRYSKGPNPLRIVTASDGQLPLDARLLNDGMPTLMSVRRTAWEIAILAITPAMYCNAPTNHAEFVYSGNQVRSYYRGVFLLRDLVNPGNWYTADFLTVCTEL
ncbi:RibD family protein [Zhongshania sp.]|jgi:riboflavin biosynthesis pyrimidine reductase|uniref:RibD family protein n=1 Tax=Zhongshania sp. TaxID=1971902 RepID=UPI002A82C90D|nr:dihydrofolate reductase family protein [Zhongshania sp.]